MASLTLTYGPLLFGGAAALILSGIVSVQCLIYFKSYSQRGIKKATVLVVWVLDVLQSAFILASLCHYFVTHFGDTSVLAVIPWSVALTILVTAIQAWIVHLFYARTIHRSSGKNWVITSPVVLFATHQLLAGLVTSIQLLSIPHWTAFIKLDSVTKSRTQFMFTMGLTISAGTDIGIAICLCYYLRKIRRLSSSSIMKGVFNTLTIYTIENGLFMSITTIATLVCWVTLPTSSLSFNIYFILAHVAVYPNSLLLLFNTRKELREMHSGDQGIHFDPSVHLANYYPQFPHRAPAMSQTKAPLTAPAPIHDYHPLFKMHQVPNPTQRDSVQISDFQIQSFSPPRSRRVSIEHWTTLP